VWIFKIGECFSRIISRARGFFFNAVFIKGGSPKNWGSGFFLGGTFRKKKNVIFFWLRYTYGKLMFFCYVQVDVFDIPVIHTIVQHTYYVCHYCI